MNYRHAFHAGNFADVVKHVCLVALLRGLSRKDSPWLYLDTHAGAGRYDLRSPPAQKTGEYRTGIELLKKATGSLPPALSDYLDVLRALTDTAQPPHDHYYPGSPLLAAALARPQDRLVTCELNPLEHAALDECLRGQRRCKEAGKGESEKSHRSASFSNSISFGTSLARISPMCWCVMIPFPSITKVSGTPEEPIASWISERSSAPIRV